MFDFYNDIFKKDPKYDQAYKLYLEYLYQCSIFDKAHCSIREHGQYLPASKFEELAIKRNSEIQKKKMLEKATVLKVSNEELNRAKKELSRISDDGIIELYDRYNEK